VNERTLRYAIARLGSFRNIWWSMANEWDFVKNRPVEEWNALFDVITAEDPYKHLTSIHNGSKWFDHNHKAITHVSIQSGDMVKMRGWREQYGKPAINDEAMYEGDIDHSWGNITGRELVYRHWIGFLRGTYVGHGETFLVDGDKEKDILWWARGGVLRGESPPRIAFLRKLIEQGGTLEPVPDGWPLGNIWPAARQQGQPGKAGRGDKPGTSFLVYFGVHQPKMLTQSIVGSLTKGDPGLKEARWTFEVIDPWEMTVTPIAGEHQGKFRLALPGKPHLVLRATPVPGTTTAAAP
jgi:hypothetical protein